MHGDTGIGIIGQIRDVVSVIVFTAPLDGSALAVERDGPAVSVGVVDIEHDALCCSARSGESLTADNAPVGAKDVANGHGLPPREKRQQKQYYEKTTRSHCGKGYNAAKISIISKFNKVIVLFFEKTYLEWRMADRASRSWLLLVP